MKGRIRRTAPKVRDGKVQKKNSTRHSPHYYFVEPGNPVIERHRPGPKHRHLLMKRDIELFIGLLPNWKELSKGLQAILLAESSPNCMGWHRPGVVAICPWYREISGEWCRVWVESHRSILDRLGVKTEVVSKHLEFVHWTETSAKGFQLMHILLHEFGHHHDRMTTRHRLQSARGEDYAEQYAYDSCEDLWPKYFGTFGW